MTFEAGRYLELQGMLRDSGFRVWGIVLSDLVP